MYKDCVIWNQFHNLTGRILASSAGVWGGIKAGEEGHITNAARKGTYDLFSNNFSGKRAIEMDNIVRTPTKQRTERNLNLSETETPAGRFISPNLPNNDQ